jgi:hypothetical protein
MHKTFLLFLKYILKSIGLVLLVGLIIYAIAKFMGPGVNSTMIGAVIASVVTAMNPPKLFSSKSY